jgi:hypothetical protein
MEHSEAACSLPRIIITGFVRNYWIYRNTEEVVNVALSHSPIAYDNVALNTFTAMLCACVRVCEFQLREIISYSEFAWFCSSKKCIEIMESQSKFVTHKTCFMCFVPDHLFVLYRKVIFKIRLP